MHVSLLYIAPSDSCVSGARRQEDEFIRFKRFKDECSKQVRQPPFNAFKDTFSFSNRHGEGGKNSAVTLRKKEREEKKTVILVFPANVLRRAALPIKPSSNTYLSSLGVILEPTRHAKLNLK